MKVLLTGASGQVGGAIQRTAPAGYEIVALDAQHCDLGDAAALRQTIQTVAPDLLINCAAYTAVDRAEDEPELARAINADAIGVMVSALEETGGKLVHLSTDFVFDGRSPIAYAPDAARAPLSVYGQTKADGEDHLRSSDLLIRTAWVYEAGGANFVRTMIRLMKERDSLGVVTDQIGAPTWATGLAATVWGLVERQASGTFHHCDAGVASWYDFAVAIAEEAQAVGLISAIPHINPITTADYPTPATRPAFSLLDCRTTRQLLGDNAVHWRTHLRAMLKQEMTLG